MLTPAASSSSLDAPTFMPGQSDAGSAPRRDSGDESVRSSVAAAETERALLEALAAQDAEIMKLKQMIPPKPDSVRRPPCVCCVCVWCGCACVCVCCMCAC